MTGATEADQSCATGALERAFSQLKPDHYVAIAGGVVRRGGRLV